MKEDVERRLANWGRWSRNGRTQKPNASPLYRLMKENDPSFSPSEPHLDPDALDAVLVDKVIMAVCSELEKEILRLKFIIQLTDIYVCHRTRVRFNNFYGRYQKILQKLDLALKDATIQ